MGSLDRYLEMQAREAFKQGERTWGRLPRNRNKGTLVRGSLALGMVKFDPQKTLEFMERGFFRLKVNVRSPRTEAVIRAGMFGLAVGAIGAAALLKGRE